MASILSNDARIGNLKEFARSIRDDCYYLFIARPLPWGDESTPDTPKDNRKAFRDLWDQAIAAKRMLPENVHQGVPIVSWLTGTYYDMYRHDYDGSVAGVSGIGGVTHPASLYEAVYFIMDPSTRNVYKCLYNRSATTNLAVASTVLPTSTSSGVIVTGDGYHWAYMFTVSSGDNTRYATSFFIPAPTVAVANLVDGGIYSITVDAAGAYTVAPTVVIHGDGAGAAATAHLSGGGVVYISIDSPGSGYSHAKITFTGGTGAGGTTATAIIGPRGGHGSRPAEELPGTFLLVEQQFISDEIGSKFPITNDYRQVGLVKNPTKALTGLGTVGVMADATGAPTYDVIGNGTTFTSDVAVGDILRIEDTNNGVEVLLSVGSITDNTHLVLSALPLVNELMLTAKGLTTPTPGYNFSIIPNAQTMVLSKSMTFTGALSGSGSFAADATITGGTSGAIGTVVDYNTTTHLCHYVLDYTIAGNIVDFAVADVVDDGAGQTGTIATLTPPEVSPESGQLIYYENRVAVIRAADQVEDYKVIFEF